MSKSEAKIWWGEIERESDQKHLLWQRVARGRTLVCGNSTDPIGLHNNCVYNKVIYKNKLMFRPFQSMKMYLLIISP